MQNKVYITNFWYALNYGANLTALALYSLISEKVSQTFLLDNMQSVEKHFFNKFYVKKFAQKYLKYRSFDNEDNAILITGSDQVFNPLCEAKYNETKFLDFAKFNNKKIAFSASFGVDKETFLTQNSKETIAYMDNVLKTFDYISVREKSGLEICKEVFNCDAEWIIDPVFLQDRNFWENFANGAGKKFLDKLQNYKIVSHIFEKTKDHEKVCGYFAHKYNTSVLEFGNYKYSPEEWLSAIKNCELFITNSFHGVCFAIIFNKPFICLSKETGKSARFQSLFEMLNIDDKSTCLEDIYKKDCIFKIDYDKVNERIKEERLKGILFLDKVLYSDTKSTKEKYDAKVNLLERRILKYQLKNTMSYQIKKYFWDKWLVIYYCYLPKVIQKFIGIIRNKVI